MFVIRRLRRLGFVSAHGTSSYKAMGMPEAPASSDCLQVADWKAPASIIQAITNRICLGGAAAFCCGYRGNLQPSTGRRPDDV